MGQRVAPFQLVAVDCGRISLPADYVSRTPWLSGNEPVSGVLLLLEPGRYRLISEDRIQRSSTLQRIWAEIHDLSLPDDDIEPFEAESPGSALLKARLIPVEIAPKKNGWRLPLPLEFNDFKTQLDKWRVPVLISDGYIEIWSETLFQRAVTASFEELVSL